MLPGPRTWSPRTLGPPLAFLAVCLTLAAYFFLVHAPRARREASDAVLRDLTQRADERESAIETWMAGRVAMARVVAQLPSTALLAEGRAPDAEAIEQRDHLGQVLQAFVNDAAFDLVFVAGPADQVLAQSSAAAVPAGCLDASRAVGGHAQAWFGTHRHGEGSTVVQVVVAVGQARVVAESAADTSLCPMATRPPLEANTAAATLSVLTGGLIVPICASFAADDLPRPLPLETPSLPAANAFRSGDVAGEFKDHRGRVVLAVARRLANSSAALVLEVERSELEARVNGELLRTASYGGVLVLGAGALLVLGLRYLRREQDLNAARAAARQAALLDRANDAILFVSTDGYILDANRTAERLYGCAKSALIGRHVVRDLRPPDAREPGEVQLAIVKREGRFVFETVHVTADGTRIPVEVSGSRVDDDGGGTLVAVVRDVRDRRQLAASERALADQRRLLERIAELSPVLIYLYDLDEQRVIYSNHRYATHLGYGREDIDVQRSGEAMALLHPDDRARSAERLARYAAAADGEVIDVEYRQRHKDGNYRWVSGQHVIFSRHEDGRPGQILGVAQDVTDRRRLQEQFLQAQKMEGIGRLAGGVAHDFNNLLTAIVGYAELLKLQLPSDHPGLTSVDEITKAGGRAATLTSQLLAFARRQVVEARVVEVNAVVADAERMLRRLVGEDVELVTVLDPDAGAALIDAGQLQQVLVNLAVNARDAMPRGGRLVIETANVQLDEPYARTHLDVRPGRYVLIAVSDTGTGIPAEVLAHVFEPFYTTKPHGRGTGLGLATCHGIVSQAGGHIGVYSEQGLGTSFRVYLPHSAPAAPEAASPPAPPPRGGHETVLLIEDDANVRSLAALSLKSYGYRVIEAAHGRDALESRACPRPRHRRAGVRCRDAGRGRPRAGAANRGAVPARARALHVGARRGRDRARGPAGARRELPVEAVHARTARAPPAGSARRLRACVRFSIER